MGRWEPGTRERLERAALELFAKQGYDSTTVAQIAARAKSTKSTFFRHFSDKREILFGGQDALTQLFADTITGATATHSPMQAIAAALDSVGAAMFTPQRHDLAPQRRVAIASSPELQERELLKRSGLSAAMAAALRTRGVPEPAATLSAGIGVLAFSSTYAAWAEPTNTEEFGPIARRILRELTTTATQLE